MWALCTYSCLVCASWPCVNKSLVLTIFNEGAYLTFKSILRPSIYFSPIVISS